jgi:hypothetical protein
MPNLSPHSTACGQWRNAARFRVSRFSGCFTHYFIYFPTRSDLDVIERVATYIPTRSARGERVDIHMHVRPFSLTCPDIHTYRQPSFSMGWERFLAGPSHHPHALSVVTWCCPLFLAESSNLGVYCVMHALLDARPAYSVCLACSDGIRACI